MVLHKNLLQQPLLFGNEVSQTFTNPKALVDNIEPHVTSVNLSNEKKCFYKYSQIDVNDIKVTTELLSHVAVGAVVNSHSFLVALDGHYEIKTKLTSHQAYREHGLIIPPVADLPLSSSRHEMTSGLLINFDLARLNKTSLIMRGEAIERTSIQPVSLQVNQVDFLHLLLALVSQINGVNGNEKLLALNGFDDQCYRLLAMMMQPEFFLNAKPTQQDRAIINNDFIRMVESYVEEHVRLPINVTQLQEFLGLSARGLQYATNKYFGCSPRQYLYNKKLDLAYELLRDINNQKTILEISSELGFSSQSRFTAFFAKRFGFKPSEIVKKRLIG